MASFIREEMKLSIKVWLSGQGGELYVYSNKFWSSWSFKLGAESDLSQVVQMEIEELIPTEGFQSNFDYGQVFPLTDSRSAFPSKRVVKISRCLSLYN